MVVRFSKNKSPLLLKYVDALIARFIIGVLLVTLLIIFTITINISYNFSLFIAKAWDILCANILLSLEVFFTRDGLAIIIAAFITGIIALAVNSHFKHKDRLDSRYVDGVFEKSIDSMEEMFGIVNQMSSLLAEILGSIESRYIATDQGLIKLVPIHEAHIRSLTEKINSVQISFTDHYGNPISRILEEEFIHEWYLMYRTDISIFMKWCRRIATTEADLLMEKYPDKKKEIREFYQSEHGVWSNLLAKHTVLPDAIQGLLVEVDSKNISTKRLINNPIQTLGMRKRIIQLRKQYTEIKGIRDDYTKNRQERFNKFVTNVLENTKQ